MSSREEKTEILLHPRFPKFKSLFNSAHEEMGEIRLQICNFKSWFNSARFLNKRPPKCWSIGCTVGTERVDLQFVVEVVEDNRRLLVTICNLSTYDVCFGGTMSAAMRMDVSSIFKLVWSSLGIGRHQVRVDIFIYRRGYNILLLLLHS